MLHLCTCVAENQGINDTNLFEGDIILTPGQKWTAEHELDVDSSRRKRGSSRRRLWPGGIIVYAIQSTLGKLCEIDKNYRLQYE